MKRRRGSQERGAARGHPASGGARPRRRAPALAAGVALALALTVGGCGSTVRSVSMARTYVGDGVADASSAVATARLVVAQVRAGRILVPTAEVTLDESVAALVRATRHQATLVPPNRATAGLRDEALTATDQARTGVVAARDALAETTGARLSAAAGRLAAAAAALDAVGAEATG